MNTHDNAFDYIRKSYGVPAEFGRRVIINGKLGTICEAQGHRIGVRFDHHWPDLVRSCHPTWEVEYLEEVIGQPQRRWVWSCDGKWDEHGITFNSLDAMIAYAQTTSSNEELIGRRYWVAELVEKRASAFFDIDALLENLRAAVSDVFGDCYSGCFDLPEETKAVLDAGIKRLLTDHIAFSASSRVDVQAKNIVGEDFKGARQ
ncbi:hypothetical protein [Parachitinimonas caeni]|uniref:DUF4304 domain-containing protein n=1 Tax=Parachitinimonas caeni TaxID=3031301 RepID=A0ABT7E2D3_9NEIS|nr:hypothetical protein [Parachitinimonas caeni]MDK2126471.1 hypothetical protein [Parachitinimonas caeni]